MDTRKIVIDTEACVKCGDCSLLCPVSVYNVSPPPCQTACPINTDVVTYISLITQERFDEALDSIRQINPFPGIMGRVCTHPCERECRRTEIDEPIAIRALKRSAAEFGNNISQVKPSPLTTRVEKVAIIGSGPAGLMGAYDLARLGYQVTIFESLPVAGGLLSVGIPEYRLPREIIKAEIGDIENLGVEIRLNTAIGKDMTLDALFEQDYKAVLIAVGAHKSLRLGISGEDKLEGIEDAISFLRKVNLGGKRNLRGKAIVIGGGNAAIDSARILLRLGCDEVNTIYRRSRQEMPAIESEVIAAQQEGVKIHYLVAPTKVLDKDGKVVGLECINTELGEPDASGRRRPVPVKGSEFSMKADLIISAVGQKPDLSFLAGNDNLSVSDEGLVMVNTGTMATSRPGVFAAGDVVRGPSTVVDALASGRSAAIGIDWYLRGQDFNQAGEQKVEAGVEGEKQIWWDRVLKSERREELELLVKERALNFNEVKLGLPKSLAVEEARRCLGCSIFTNIDIASCCGDSCRTCQFACWKGAITVR